AIGAGEVPAHGEDRPVVDPVDVVVAGERRPEARPGLSAVPRDRPRRIRDRVVDDRAVASVERAGDPGDAAHPRAGVAAEAGGGLHVVPGERPGGAGEEAAPGRRIDAAPGTTW